MPRGGIEEKINNIGRGPRERVALCPPSALLLAPFFSHGFVYRSSFFAPKPHGNACYAGYGGPRERSRSLARGAHSPLFYLRHIFRAGLTIVPRSLLLNRTETLATRAMAD